MRDATVLVTGGAGYIGAHLVQLLVAEGARVVVVDDLSTGHREALAGAELVVGDCGDEALIERVCRRNAPVGVFHLAAFTDVEESMRDPGRYYRNNVVATLHLLDALVRCGAPPVVFSSSAAVYGEPHQDFVDETHPLSPVNPYGHTKQTVELMLEDYGRAHALPYVSLRYFNVAGADPEGRVGDRRGEATSVIPRVLQTAAGERPEFGVFGDDYPTRDGTCVRDFIHVTDLAAAHILALRHLQRGGESGPFNLGNGAGFTVAEVLEAARRVTGRPIPSRVMARRPGDLATMVADSTRAQEVLGWHTRYGDLETILRHAWDWQCRLEAGRT